MNLKISSLLLFSSLLLNNVQGSEKYYTSDGIGSQLERYSSVVSPQKVYLHLDKSSYSAGQTIWFKAYVFDGTDNKPYKDSTNVYVDLIGSNGKTLARRILLAGNGTAIGDMLLGSDIPEGNYIVRGYTGWMRNFDKELFFTRELYIRNPGYANIISRTEVRRNRRFNRDIERMEGRYQVAFYPEGGNLLSGTLNRVAVKVVDELGRGHSAKGELIDDSGNVVERFETNSRGVGLIDFEPLAGRSYEALVSVNGERASSYDLPAVNHEDFAIRVHQTEEQVRINLVASVSPGNRLYTDEVILIGHTRGIPMYSNSFSITDGRLELSVDKTLFPSGITHFTVFNGNKVPVAERLVFIDREDQLEISSEIGLVTSGEADSVDLTVSITDHNGNPAGGSFSLSAVSGHTEPEFGYPSIVSYILFDSDLNGNVFNSPAFLDPALDVNVAVDQFLLTYGWRRFKWEDVLSGNLPEISYLPAPGLTVSGRLVNPSNDETVANSEVQLKVNLGDEPDVFTTTSGRGGVFEFGGLFYEGPVEIELSTRRLAAGYPPRIEIDEQQGPAFNFSPGLATRVNNITSRGDDWSRTRAELPAYGSASDGQSQPRRFGTPDQTIFIDHEKQIYNNVLDVLQQYGRGMAFERGSVRIVGHSNLEGPIEPAFMLDGRYTGAASILGMNPREIERIEIFRRGSAAIFGMKGGGGVILAYTRKPGQQVFVDAREFVIAGFHAPREFYSDLIPIPGFTGNDELVKTIYWDPSLEPDTKGNLNIRVPLYPGLQNLMFMIEGAGYDGGLGFSMFTIELH